MNLPKESDAALQALLVQARAALQRVAARTPPTKVIPFPADRIVRIHRKTGPAAEALPGGSHV